MREPLSQVPAMRRWRTAADGVGGVGGAGHRGSTVGPQRGGEIDGERVKAKVALDR